jgi:hypothetical protein
MLKINKIMFEVKLGQSFTSKKESNKSVDSFVNKATPYFYYKNKGKRRNDVETKWSSKSSPKHQRKDRIDLVSKLKEKYLNMTNYEILQNSLTFYLQLNKLKKGLTLNDLLSDIGKKTCFGMSIPFIVNGKKVNR